MNRYLIQRNIPDAGRLSPDELCGAARKSCSVIASMAPRVQWVHSYVTDDHLFCEYLAEDEDAVREHGRSGGFPVDEIWRVGAVIDPMTASAVGAPS